MDRGAGVGVRRPQLGRPAGAASDSGGVRAKAGMYGGACVAGLACASHVGPVSPPRAQYGRVPAAWAPPRVGAQSAAPHHAQRQRPASARVDNLGLQVRVDAAHCRDALAHRICGSRRRGRGAVQSSSNRWSAAHAARFPRHTASQRRDGVRGRQAGAGVIVVHGHGPATSATPGGHARCRGARLCAACAPGPAVSHRLCGSERRLGRSQSCLQGWDPGFASAPYRPCSLLLPAARRGCALCRRQHPRKLHSARRCSLPMPHQNLHRC